MTSIHDKLTKAISNVVRLLAERKFDELERLTQGQRLTAEMIRMAISDYGRTVCVPETYQGVDIVPIERTNGQAWSAWVPLHTLEEGRSDLTLLLRLLEMENGEIQTEIDDIRVL